MQPQVNNNSSGFLEIGNIVKSGYLKKLKTMRKKFFVIWGATEATSARLEYYDNEKKFRLGLAAKKSILLSTCFNINKMSDMKNKFVIALYTRDDYFAIVLEDEELQNEWLKVLLEQQRASGDGRPIPHFEHIWQATVKSKGLGSSQNLSGSYRLCLTAGTINLVKMNADNGDLQFPLSVVRRCGHSDCFFFMEVGRQAVTGSGEMWMQVEDSVIAQNIHEATLNAMRSSGQDEDMRPRSHSGSTTAGDIKPNAAITRHSSIHITPSRRHRCDSFPVASRDGGRALRTRGNSEGEDCQREDDYANPPSGLLKSSKPRPRTSSEGESHFRGNPTPESPNKNRGRFSMPAMRSVSMSSGFIRPSSVHRIVVQPISNSPPIPNSPLSESPRSFTDDRFIPGPNHPVGHSPTDLYKEEHFFGSSYNNGQMDSLKRYPSTSRSRTPESQLPIREESIEVDDYMNMATPNTTDKDCDPYMNMSPANQTPRSSFSGSLGGVTSPPISPTSKGPVPVMKGSLSSDSGVQPIPPGPEGYMMMAPSSAAKNRPASQTEPVPLVTSYDSTPYMYMSPPIPSTKKATSPLRTPTLRLPSTSGSVSSESSSDGSNCPPSSEATPKESDEKLNNKTKETLFDSYANVEFSPVLSHQTETKDGDKSDGPTQGEMNGTAEYMNMVYNKKKQNCNGQVSTILANGLDNKKTLDETERRNDRSNVVTTTQNGQNGDYARMTFIGKEKTVVKDSSTNHKLFESDFMNVDRSMGSTRLTFSNPQSPSSSVSKGPNVLNNQTLQHSLEELKLNDKSNVLLNHPSSKSIPGTTHPKGSLMPNHNVHHSTVNNASQKYELNYIDVEADIGNAPRISDSGSLLSPSSPYRAALGSDDKDAEPVTYATIDFTKSEGLRNVSAMRESRF